ncbi:MAG: hypothetical protein LRS46_00620 [Desulfurococcales archaeon]|nr:hypothetical protein [Desulfurococcales archaeon]
MRFPKKREWSALFILYEEGRELNMGTAVDLLRDRLCVTKRTARNILKRLARLGLINFRVADGQVRVEILNPSEALARLVNEYVSTRRRRCRLEGSSRTSESR